VVARSIYEEAGASLEKPFINAFLSELPVTFQHLSLQVQQSKRVARDCASHLPLKGRLFLDIKRTSHADERGACHLNRLVGSTRGYSQPNVYQGA
jgi:hypothetical protein